MNYHFNFEWEFRNFKIKTNHEKDKDSPVSKKCPIEFVKYNDDSHTSCHTIAWWELNNSGYNLMFRGNIPFEEISPEEIASIWVQLCSAQKMLDEYFEACDKEEELECW